MINVILLFEKALEHLPHDITSLSDVKVGSISPLGRHKMKVLHHYGRQNIGDMIDHVYSTLSSFWFGVFENPKDRDWKELSARDDVTFELIYEFYITHFCSFPWDIKILSYNPHLRWDLFVSNMWETNKYNYGKDENGNVVVSETIIGCEAKYLIVNCRKLDWNGISRNSHITFGLMEKAKYFPWSPEGASNNINVTRQTVKFNPKGPKGYPWGWKWIMRPIIERELSSI